MRGDVTLSARLLLRGSGLAGLAAVVGGVLALVAARTPWFHALAEVHMLGASAPQVLASGGTLPGHWLGWTTAVLGLLVAATGIAIAVDRPPAGARFVMAAGATGLAVVAVLGLAMLPEVAALAGGEAGAAAALGDRLPVGVELTLAVTRGTGGWLALVAAAVTAAGAVGARHV